MKMWSIMGIAAAFLWHAVATFAQSLDSEPLPVGRLGGIEGTVFNSFFLDHNADNPEKELYIRYALYAEPHEFSGFLKDHHFDSVSTNCVAPRWYVQVVDARSLHISHLCTVERDGKVGLVWNCDSYGRHHPPPAQQLGEAERLVVNWLSAQYEIAIPREDLFVRLAMYDSPLEFSEALQHDWGRVGVATNDVSPKWYIAVSGMKPSKATYLCSVDSKGDVALESMRTGDDAKWSFAPPAKNIAELPLGDLTLSIKFNDKVCFTESNFETALHRRLKAHPVSNDLWRVEYAFRVVERNTRGARASVLASNSDHCQISRDRLFETLRLNVHAKPLGKIEIGNHYSGLLAIFDQEQDKDGLKLYEIKDRLKLYELMRPTSLTDLWEVIVEQAEDASVAIRGQP